MLSKSREAGRRFQLSGFDDATRRSLASSITKLGATYIDDPFFNRRCTHVVSKSPGRLEKYLLGCASGIWLLTAEFVRDSAKAGRWTEEANYCWSRRCDDSKHMTSYESAANRWKKRRPFSDWKVAVATKKKGKDYKKLLECGGAVVFLKTDSSSLAEFVEKKSVTHVFADADVCGIGKDMPKNVLVLKPEYMIQYLISDSLPDTKEFEIPSENVDAVTLDSGEVMELSMVTSENFCWSAKKRRRVEMPFDSHVQSSSRKGPEVSVSTRKRMNRFADAETLLQVVHSLPCFPPPESLGDIVKELLSDSVDFDETQNIYYTLRRVLSLHPPWKSAYMRFSYLQSLGRNQGRNSLSLFDVAAQAWTTVIESIKSIVSSSSTDVVASSAMKFVEFFAALVTQDFDHALKESEETQQLQQTLLWQLIWVKERLPHANTKVQELIKLILDSACNEVLLTQNLLEIVLRIAKCINASESASKSLIGQRSESLAWEFALAIKSTKNCGGVTIRLLQSIKPAWLAFKICHFLLDRYASMKPSKEEMKNDLEHVMNRHLFLIPNVDGVAKVTSENKSSSRLAEVSANLPSQSQKKYKNLKKRNLKGETPLQVYCIKGDVEAVRECLALGANPNSADHAGWTPLHEVASRGDAACMKELMKYGTTTSKFNSAQVLYLSPSSHDGTTPLHDAASNGKIEAARLLLSRGGKSLLCSLTNAGKSPRDVASTDAVRQLFDEWDDGNSVSEEVTTSQVFVRSFPESRFAPTPTPADYSSLGGVFPAEACSLYAFLVAREFTSYIEHQLITPAGLSAADLRFIESTSDFLETFRAHLSALVKTESPLPPIVNVYLKSMAAMASVF